MATFKALTLVFFIIYQESICDILPDERDVECHGIADSLGKVYDSLFHKDVVLPYSGLRFSISTREHPGSLEFSTQIDTISNSNFKIERPTIIIVHGFLSYGRVKWMEEMKDAFLEWKDVNVMLVDWGSMARTLNYVRAASNTKDASMAITKILTETVKSLGDGDGKTWGPIHIIGHSLGAQISGRVARIFNRQNLTWKVERVTGLDPANPCFGGGSEYTLRKNDAPFVDVIHTNGKPFSDLGLGLFNELGHVDFYPNGGMEQRGCEHISSDVDSKCFPITSGISRTAGALLEMLCHHGRAYDYFTESILAAARNEHPFWGYGWNRTFNGALAAILNRCSENKCPKMGILADESLFHGPFYVFTETSKPFRMEEQSLAAMVSKALNKVQKIINAS